MTTIQALVDRFLAWPVPASVRPDGVPGKPGRIGTNLLSADEARQMLEHLLGTPAPVWVVAKQHTELPEVSIFTTSSERTAQEYEAIGWTVRRVDVLPPTAGVKTGEPRGPVHSCKNCAHLAKGSCDEPCAGCTVRWRSGVSDRWEPAYGVRGTEGGSDAPR